MRDSEGDIHLSHSFTLHHISSHECVALTVMNSSDSPSCGLWLLETISGANMKDHKERRRNSRLRLGPMPSHHLSY